MFWQNFNKNFNFSDKNLGRQTSLAVADLRINFPRPKQKGQKRDKNKRGKKKLQKKRSKKESKVRLAKPEMSDEFVRLVLHDALELSKNGRKSRMRTRSKIVGNIFFFQISRNHSLGFFCGFWGILRILGDFADFGGFCGFTFTHRNNESESPEII